MALATLVLSWGGALHAAAIRASNDPVKDERPITTKDREHWAWKPLTEVDAAGLDAVVAMKTPIEKEADAATLIRRVTFDLTGLPPTPEEVSSFVIRVPRGPLSSLPTLRRALGAVVVGSRPLRGVGWL